MPIAKSYVVHARAGYFSPTSDIAQHYGIAQLPRTTVSRVDAVSASDACAKVVAWMTSDIRAMRKEYPHIEPVVVEAVACTEIVPTHAELLVIANASK